MKLQNTSFEVRVFKILENWMGLRKSWTAIEVSSQIMQVGVHAGAGWKCLHL